MAQGADQPATEAIRMVRGERVSWSYVSSVRDATIPRKLSCDQGVLVIPPGQYVLADGLYFGTVRQSVPVQNEHGYSVAYLVQFQREVDPCQGWFLARDVIANRRDH